MYEEAVVGLFLNIFLVPRTLPASWWVLIIYFQNERVNL